MPPEASQCREELPKSGERMHGSSMGYGKVPLFPLCKTLQTDQKPLVSIFKKHMADVSTRIQMLAIRTWNYDFTPEYLQGELNVISNAFSHENLQETKNFYIEKEILAVNIVFSSTIQQAEIDELQKATSEDTELQCLKTVISNSRPAQRSSCSDAVKNYWNYR